MPGTPLVDPHRGLIPAARAFTCTSVSGPPLFTAKAGMGVPGRPSLITRNSTESGTIDRKTASLSGGAGPSVPTGPMAASTVLPVQTHQSRQSDPPRRVCQQAWACPGDRSQARGTAKASIASSDDDHGWRWPFFAQSGFCSRSILGRSATKSTVWSGPRPAGVM